MQVACDQCGATYEFDAGAIPADGYDAQCTNCKHIFFVAPRPSEGLITVTCATCKTVYRFAASDIPAGGYDAQCTQCQAVFFVSATPGAEVGPAVLAKSGSGPQTAAPRPPSSPASPSTPSPPSPSRAPAPSPTSPSATVAAPKVTPPRLPPPMPPAPPASAARPAAGAAPSPPKVAIPVAGPVTAVPSAPAPRPTPTAGPAPTPAPIPAPAPLPPVVAALTPTSTFASESFVDGTAPHSAPSSLPPSRPPASSAAAQGTPAASVNGGAEPDLDVPTADLDMGDFMSAPPADGAGLGVHTGTGADAGAASPFDLVDAGGRAVAPAALAPQASALASAPPVNGAEVEEIAIAADDVDISEVDRPRSRGRGLLWAAVALLVVLGLVIGAAFAMPSVYNVTLGRWLGVRRSVSPVAAAALAHARQAILPDTEAAYTQALTFVEQARAAEPNNPDADALSGLIMVFHGLDKRFAAQQLRDQNDRDEAEAVAAGASEAADVQHERREYVRVLAVQQEIQAKHFDDEANKALGEALALLTDSVKNHSDSPLLLLAAGFCYATDPALAAKAEEMLTRSVEARQGKGSVLDINHAPDAMTVYLRAVLWLRQTENRSRVREALTAALKLEPNLQRARFDLGMELIHAGDNEQATRVFKEITSAVPDHQRAVAMLATLSLAPPPPAPVVDPTPAPPPDQAPPAIHTKKNKAKRRAH